MPAKQSSIGKQLHLLLDEAETKMFAFKTGLDHKAVSLEATADLTLAEFQGFLHEGTVWMDNLVQQIHDESRQAHTALDTAKVKAHLALMDTKDATEELRVRLDRFKGELDSLIKKTERTTSEQLAHLSKKTQIIIKSIES
ncbi:MAG: hypothetical protein H7249_17955 [Chitinophagaceae bacterium]|nr:hypothetical protein [Oligoflexus sp.]